MLAVKANEHTAKLTTHESPQVTSHNITGTPPSGNDLLIYSPNSFLPVYPRHLESSTPSADSTGTRAHRQFKLHL